MRDWWAHTLTALAVICLMASVGVFIWVIILS